MREEKRKRRELQEIEKKQAMEKILALKKTTVGARALKNLTEQVIKRCVIKVARIVHNMYFFHFLFCFRVNPQFTRFFA